MYQPFQRVDRLYTSESDVYRRQILTYKDGPRTKRIEKNLIAVYTYNIGLQMKRKELCKTFLMISN